MDWRSVIAARQVVRFNYHGHTRVVVPATFGLERHTGNSVLRGYQVGGTSGSGHVPDWRLFRVDQISAPTIEAGTSAPPPGYHRNDRQMSLIFAQL